jgi:hypothetical protein
MERRREVEGIIHTPFNFFHRQIQAQRKWLGLLKYGGDSRLCYAYVGRSTAQKNYENIFYDRFQQALTEIIKIYALNILCPNPIYH